MFEYEDIHIQFEALKNHSTLRSHTALASGFGWPNFTSHATKRGAEGREEEVVN